MANISLSLYTNGFFGSVLKSPTQMGSLSINNSVTNISRLGTFKVMYIMFMIFPRILHPVLGILYSVFSNLYWASGIWNLVFCTVIFMNIHLFLRYKLKLLPTSWIHPYHLSRTPLPTIFGYFVPTSRNVDLSKCYRPLMVCICMSC